MKAEMSKGLPSINKAEERRLASRLKIETDGSYVFKRFNKTERFEHQIFMVSFSLLAITGLAQRYSGNFVASLMINNLMGGIEFIRGLHRATAIIFTLETIFHFFRYLYLAIARRSSHAMLPNKKDFKDAKNTFKFFVNKRKNQPGSDRFSFEEKAEYWASIWGTVVMILTGFIQWFPVKSSEVLSGSAIPISRAVHGWEAILAVMVIVFWHIINVISKKNKSIFSGTMTEEQMIKFHPLEYKKIMVAHKKVHEAE